MMVENDDQCQTAKALMKAMNDLVLFVRHTSEDCTMFEDMTLPILDTMLWVADNEQVKYKFYEKPTIPNRVLQNGTALSDASISASLVQDVVRGLLNSGLDTPTMGIQSILSKFASKMVNSGHTAKQTQVVLVQGNHRVGLSKLNPENGSYKPLHFQSHTQKLNAK